MTEDHLTSEQLSALLDGALPARAAAEAERHVAGCASCRDALAALGAQEESLRRALTHDPGDAYFATFAERVSERIRAGARGSEAPKRRAPFRFGAPRTLAWLSAAAAVAAGVGIAFLASRETPVAPLRDREAIERAQRAEEAPGASFARPPAAAGSQATDELRALRPEAPAETRAREDGGAKDERGRAAMQATPPAATVPGANAPAAGAEAEKQAPSVAAGPARAAAGAVSPSAAGGAAAPGRAQEVRRNEQGEEVPVPSYRVPQPRFAPPPAPSTTGGPVTVIKRATAVPMQSKEAPEPDQAAAKSPASSTGELSFSKSLEDEKAAPARVCGEVRDSQGRPVAGARVVIVEEASTAATDAAGRFCVRSVAGERTLSVMAIGFVPAQQRVRAGSGAPPANVTLKPVPVLGGSALGFTAADRVKARTLAGIPDSLRAPVEAAQFLTSAAARDATAGAWDRAAAAWAALVPALPAGAPESEARFQLAAARYHAWELEPGGARRAAAAAALDAYLAGAPAGVERDQARAWRGELGR